MRVCGGQSDSKQERSESCLQEDRSFIVIDRRFSFDDHLQIALAKAVQCGAFYSSDVGICP